MNIKVRFWCPTRKAFITDVRCWTSCDGNLYVIGSKEEEVITQLATGCPDKNKTEIFEGDIINYRGMIGTVVFFAGRFQVDWNDQTDDALSTMTIDKMEIIGHVNDGNPRPESKHECAGCNNIIPLNKEYCADCSDDSDMSVCEQCDERAWDGYICHACGMKNI